MGAVLWSAVLHAVLHSTQPLQPLQLLCETQVALCSLQSLMKTICNSWSAAGFILLQPSSSLLAMEASYILGGELEGPQVPVAPGASNP